MYSTMCSVAVFFMRSLTRDVDEDVGNIILVEIQVHVIQGVGEEVLFFSFWLCAYAFFA